MKVCARAPCRVDLAGGTLDIHPLYLLLDQAATVNLAVNIYAEVQVEETAAPGIRIESLDRAVSFTLEPDGRPPQGAELVCCALDSFGLRGGLRLRTHSRSPAGAGIGASSALSVALVKALLRLTGRSMTDDELVRFCLDLEAAVMRTPAGCQDFYPALTGGLLDIRYPLGRTEVTPLSADLGELGDRLSLVYTGRPHHSGMNNWEVFKRFIDGEPATCAAFEEIGYAAVQMAGALRGGDWEAVTRLLGREWRQRKRLWPGISTPEIDALVRAAEELGGAGKVCGAGGGGCVVLLHGGGEAREKIAQAAAKTGATVLDCRPTQDGCEVEALED